ncbi:methyltransferase [Anaeropeptidivorans aminofermentans]|uniref:methyltransferase n=1 Tax=Anaeropeptidivorans aminofermentans TaxID=2934315 RepID=UPI0020240C6B|nr:methyltransferase [Anaeropeptidivorans aminofermentans]
MEDYQIKFIYEAAYAALKTDFFKIPAQCPEGEKAALRILDVFGISDKERCEAFLQEYKSRQLEEDSAILYEKMQELNPPSFFQGLSSSELLLYHSCNYEVSYGYGRNISRIFDFTGKKIADIGGSSGGLLSAVMESFTGASSYVFDLPEACERGKELSRNIHYIECDFFKDSPKGKYDCVILSNILHDYDDEKCICILNNMADILKDCENIFIYEDILFENGKEPVEALLYGFRLSVNFRGARQRTVGELSVLLRKSGINMELTNIYNFKEHTCLIYAK